MMPAPHAAIVGLHSAGLTEDGETVSVWLNLADGSLVACYFTLRELADRLHILEVG